MSPLTVYRWELPDGAPEARRPRGAMRARLETYVEARARTPATAEIRARTTGTREHDLDEPSRDELLLLSPILERLDRGELASVEDSLVGALASGLLESASSRSLAVQALARAQLWARGETRTAFATALPVLADADAGRLPASVACEVHVTAALIFSSLDGRIFDGGKTNAHVARAERLAGPERRPIVRFLCWYAQVTAAYAMNDLALLEVVLARASEIDRTLESPLLQAFAAEVRLVSTLFGGGAGGTAERAAADIVRLCQAHGLRVVLVRTLAQGARKLADDGAPPDEVLAVLARIESIAREGRLARGWHELFATYSACEAYTRAGRFEEAERAGQEHGRLVSDLRWAQGTAQLFLVRVLLLRGRAAEVRALAERMKTLDAAVFSETSRLLGEACEVIADLIDGASPYECVERFGERARALESAGAWSYMRRNVALAHAAMAALVGDAVQVERTARRARAILETVPSAWGSAALDALDALGRYRAGRDADAAPQIELALAAFERMGDRTHAALGRHLRARILEGLGAADAASAAADSLRELARMGIVAPPVTRHPDAVVRPPPGTGQPRSPSQLPEGALAARRSQLGSAYRRLSARGLEASAILRELLTTLEVVLPRAALRLEELDSRGNATTIGEIGEVDGPLAWTELSDGAGRRFRLGVGRALDAVERDALDPLLCIAGLALEIAALRGIAARESSPTPPDEAPIAGLVCASPEMRRLRADLSRLSRSRATVIVTGESGAGKEVVARAIHDLSVRKDRPYVAFNCAAVPRDLFEGQLFGYRKGAFTGAVTDHPGVIRAASSGTLFLDEIGELPLDVQPKLLRFLENGEIFPLGERSPVRVDVRVIAATFRDLEELVRQRVFREDLYFRLQVVPLRVPPLRERPDDLLALARHFLRKLTPEGQPVPTLAPDAIAALLEHTWPGNVRELRNTIERALAFEPLPPVLGREQILLR